MCGRAQVLISTVQYMVYFTFGFSTVSNFVFCARVCECMGLCYIPRIYSVLCLDIILSMVQSLMHKHIHHSERVSKCSNKQDE